MTDHPTPWTPKGDSVFDAEGNEVIATQDVRDQIFNAVNAHDDLVAALRKIIGGGDATGCNPQIKVDIAIAVLERLGIQWR